MSSVEFPLLNAYLAAEVEKRRREKEQALGVWLWFSITKGKYYLLDKLLDWRERMEEGFFERKKAGIDCRKQERLAAIHKQSAEAQAFLSQYPDNLRKALFENRANERRINQAGRTVNGGIRQASFVLGQSTARVVLTAVRLPGMIGKRIKETRGESI